MTGFVYFISDNAAAIKIGFSSDVETRLKGLAVSNARSLTLIGFTEGDRSQERQVHAALNDYRSSGEWFVDCPTVRALIGSILEGGLVAAGFDPRDLPPADLATLVEAKRLAEIIVRCSGASLRDGPGSVCGAPHALLWKLRYRPSKDVWADELTTLRSAALRATEIAHRRAQEDREFVVAICEQQAADLARFDFGKKQIAEAEERLRSAQGALVDEGRQ